MVGMTLEQRNRLRKFLAITVVIITGLSMLLRLRFAPLAERVMERQVDNQASDAINAAIAEQISAGDFDYNRMVTIEKDRFGYVAAIHTNMGELNRLKTGVLTHLDNRLANMSLEHLGIPVGSIFLPELFSGRGPEIPITVLAVRTTDAAFRSDFTDAGINQTLHSIWIDIHVNITVLSWSGTREIAVDSSVIAAQTVIVGTVPTTYFGMEEKNESETGN